jgi:hypothetical protein
MHEVDLTVENMPIGHLSLKRLDCLAWAKAIPSAVSLAKYDPAVGSPVSTYISDIYAKY